MTTGEHVCVNTRATIVSVATTICAGQTRAMQAHMQHHSIVYLQVCKHHYLVVSTTGRYQQTWLLQEHQQQGKGNWRRIRK